MTDLNRLTASEALQRLSARKISAQALLEACLARIRAREPALRAWVHLDEEAAMRRARAVDAGTVRGLLAGIPIGIKDVIDTADMPTQYNSACYVGHRPSTDAACVALVRRQGAIVLGKTVTTEFASRVPGPTCNPHDPRHTPGGSSSGSAAAVADAMVPFAFGTQTGGSVIRPAAYCGVVGYKPSFGSINCAGMKHLSESLDTIGVLARSVDDCALLVHVASGRAPPDLHTAQAPRVGLHRTTRASHASAATLAVLERAAEGIARRGATVRELDLPREFDALYDDHPIISGYELARGLAPEWMAWPERLSAHMRAQVEAHIDAPRARYDEARRRADACRLAFADVLAAHDVDVLLTPSAPDEAPRGLESTGEALFNRNWTLLGVPCITLPAGSGPNALPIGVQLVARRDADEALLRHANWVRGALD